jgi:hypothetical protein
MEPEIGAKMMRERAKSAKIAEIAAGPDDLTRNNRAISAISSPISEINREIAIARMSLGR